MHDSIIKSVINYKIVFKVLLLYIIFSSVLFGQINKGLWYYQQPTRDNDLGLFYVDSVNYEGFCGLVSSAMGLKYFIPNIHALLKKKYGSVDFHSDDFRGGLKSNDPFCYNAATTYTFEDFLGHRFVGRHVTTTGISYKEIEKIFKGIEADIEDYQFKMEWVHYKKFNEYLSDGWLIIMNSKQGGGHYILITGWEGNPNILEKQNYYIWDSWKEPLGLESDEYELVIDFVGNKNNIGSAKRICAYKITGAKFKPFFKDQREDSTAFAFKIRPKKYPLAHIKNNYKKVIKLENGTLPNMEEMKKYGITDIFYSIKNSSGIINFKNLNIIIHMAHKDGIRVYVDISVLNDKLAYESNKYEKAGVGWILPTDKSYFKYFFSAVISPLNKYDIDGILLDNLWYNGNNVNNRKLTDAITLYLFEIRKYLDTNNRTNVLLAATVLPRSFYSSIEFGQDITAMSSYLNLIVPLAFTHKYNENPNWTGKIIRKYLSLIPDKTKIFVGLQLIDNNQNYLTPLEIQQNIDLALSNGAKGVVLFGYPSFTEWQKEKLIDMINKTKLKGL